MATRNEEFGEVEIEVGDQLLYSEEQRGVEVKIAIIGKNGSGRFSFVNAITGVKDSDEAAKPTERTDSKHENKRILWYNPPGKQNIFFWILPSIDNETPSCYRRYFESVDVEMYDVFLMFICASCEDHQVLLLIAEEIKHRKKPVVFVHVLQGGSRRGLRRPTPPQNPGLVQEIGSEVYCIDIHQPGECDFYKLTKAIANGLPSPKKECFNKIPKIGELFALDRFNRFVKEKEEKKIVPSGDELKELLQKNGITGIQQMMDERLKTWKDVIINLAILGDSGSGKSSFINAIRGLRSSHPLGAETGSTETTKVPSSYEHPTNPNIRFWDLPGVGTPSRPEFIKFCKEIKIELYDTFLIIVSKRFTEFHRQFAETLTSMGKPFFFVRSMIDQAIEAERHDYGDTRDEMRTMEKVRKECTESLKGMKLSEEDIFLISNHHPDKWDFDRLKKAIFDKLPSNLKESFILSMRFFSEEVLCAKIKVLGERRWMDSIASIVTKLGLGPFSLFIDRKRIKKRINFYREQLRFPETGSEEFQKLSEELQRRVEKFDLERVDMSGQDTLEWMKSFDSANEFNIRIYGPFIATNRPFMFVDLFLDQVLQEMELAAKAILAETAACK
ncbi:interferon-inducible GTPase 5-like [Dendronephthya gigantea]|uniref:interferon-inducible GTPase 5-like n=1 Tax=Dendronephthya gigantea TaxID=151771 RepID=UPI00106B8D7B|nr:interferon-inducible GTPase 5-like [Dendronephthya gigantea]